jgi:hypothetical protein
MSPLWVIFLIATAVFLIIRGMSWKLVLFIAGLLFAFFIIPHDVWATAADIGNGFSNFIHQYNLH